MSKRKRKRQIQQPQRARIDPVHAYLARGARGGPQDVTERVPALVPLHDRTIAQFGVGALGGPAALEFARGGVGELRLVDHDFVDAGNIVRWPLGLQVLGAPKAEAIRGFIATSYPYVSVSAFEERLGTPRLDDDETRSQLEVLDEILEGVDLIYDASAEPGVWYALSELARDLGVPYLHTWATPGAWGGVVARVTPATPGCWLCLEHAFADGTITSPNADPAGTLQPAGCADPTFTGTSFDLTSIALRGVRLAVSTLCDGIEGGYPPTPWDVAVIHLRDQKGGLSEVVETHQLSAHRDCPRCGG